MINIKFYPKDQAAKYLIIDVASIVFLFTVVMLSDSDLHNGLKLILLLSIVCSYYIALWNKDWRLLCAVLAGYFFLIILSFFEGSVIITFGFLFADLLGRAKSKLHIGLGIVGVATLFLLILWKEQLSGIDFAVLVAFMIIQLALPILRYFLLKTTNLQTKLNEVNKQLVQQEERQRIARDLHDTIGHTLTMIKLKTELASKLVEPEQTKVKGELNDILATTRTAMKQVRELVTDMKFVSLESELEHTQELLKSAGIIVHYNNNFQQLLSSVEETMISLCLREATTNILRHSQAKRCEIHTSINDRLFCVHIKDDGIGIEMKKFGNGLVSMKERMNSLQGDVFIDGAPSGGTLVTITLPIHL
ncbi:sensor histidine kinase [Psychrobacillus sp. NPDC093200]|uniref:sensor histidine kinase n=1 Tax=Psychrobacillus sp. NPDC093200 TaxID=3390656 RepID=UPI0021B420FA